MSRRAVVLACSTLFWPFGLMAVAEAFEPDAERIGFALGSLHSDRPPAPITTEPPEVFEIADSSENDTDESPRLDQPCADGETSCADPESDAALDSPGQRRASAHSAARGAKTAKHAGPASPAKKKKK